MVDLGRGECSDAEGLISILNVGAKSVKLVASYIGYMDKELSLDLQGEIIRISLEQEHLSLQTVEVRGQGSRLKQELGLHGRIFEFAGEFRVLQNLASMMSLVPCVKQIC